MLKTANENDEAVTLGFALFLFGIHFYRCRYQCPMLLHMAFGHSPVYTVYFVTSFVFVKPVPIATVNDTLTIIYYK